jgi:Berberine and berberine like
MPAGQYRCYWKARYLSDLTDELIDLAMKNARAAPSDHSISSLWNFGGATADVAAEATAFGDRSMGWMYSLDSVWSDVAAADANIAWSREGWDSAKSYGHQGRAYLNFARHGEDSDALTRASFGENYRRVVDIKTKYDPQKRFRFNQNILPQT